jgi:hypothetical protein
VKVKDLIEKLKTFEPDTEVCVDNVDILDVVQEPAYWDGCLQILKRDENCNYYNVIGAKLESNGVKVVILPHSIEDATLNNPELPVEYTEYSRAHYFDRVEKWREEHRNIIRKVHGTYPRPEKET